MAYRATTHASRAATRTGSRLLAARGARLAIRWLLLISPPALSASAPRRQRPPGLQLPQLSPLRKLVHGCRSARHAARRGRMAGAAGPGLRAPARRIAARRGAAAWGAGAAGSEAYWVVAGGEQRAGEGGGRRAGGRAAEGRSGGGGA